MSGSSCTSSAWIPSSHLAVGAAVKAVIFARNSVSSMASGTSPSPSLTR